MSALNAVRCMARAGLCLAAITGVTVVGTIPASAAIDPNNATTVNFTADTGMFPNPERGFFPGKYGMPPGGGDPGNITTPHPAFTLPELATYRSQGITLIRDCILIGMFLNSDISQQRLDQIDADFATLRKAGFKSVPRFLYDWGMSNRDADEARILRHIDQIKPLLQRNADVIADIQGGFFGGTGEQCVSDHGYVGGWPQRYSEAGARIMRYFVKAIPVDRMMTVRYPRLKWDMFGWTSTTATPVTEATAYNGSDQSRVGFYDDGFMGDANHFAFFQLTNEKTFTKDDTRFVVMEGEPSINTDYNSKDGQVLIDMADYHQSNINGGQTDAPEVYDAWRTNGDYNDVVRRLGYRYRLVSATLPKSLKPGTTFDLTMSMVNDGWSRIHNPRNVEILLRNTTTKEIYIRDVDGDGKGKGNRLWLPGPGETKTLTVDGGLPATMPAGQYEVILHLADPYPSIHDRPEYSIRLANTGVWEAATGYNKLNHTLNVSASAGGTAHTGTPWFVRKGGATRSLSSAWNGHMHQGAGVSSGSAHIALDGRMVKTGQTGRRGCGMVIGEKGGEGKMVVSRKIVVR